MIHIFIYNSFSISVTFGPSCFKLPTMVLNIKDSSIIDHIKLQLSFEATSGGECVITRFRFMLMFCKYVVVDTFTS